MAFERDQDDDGDDFVVVDGQGKVLMVSIIHLYAARIIETHLYYF